jgi:flagellar hook-length control protein FliK
MTSIGVFLQNVPAGRDVFGGLDHSPAADAALTGSDANGDSFGALLSNLAQPAQDPTATSTPTVASTTAQGPDRSMFAGLAANGSLAAGTQSRGVDQSADQANLGASLATAASLPAKSPARAADSFVQSADAGEETPFQGPATDAKTQANPVTSLLDSLSQGSSDAPATAAHNSNMPGAFGFGANTQGEFAASPMQVASAAKAAELGQETTTPSKPFANAQGTAPPPETAAAQQNAAASFKAVQVGPGNASGSKVKPTTSETIAQQASATSSTAALTDPGTAVSSETSRLEEAAATTPPSQVPLDQTAASATSQASLTTTNGNPRAVARAIIQAIGHINGQPNAQMNGLAQAGQLGAAVSSSKTPQDKLAGTASATTSHRARPSAGGETLATADAGSILTAATQVSSLAAPPIATPAPLDANKASSTSAASSPSSSRAGSGLVASDPSVISISNALDAATTSQSSSATSPDSFQIQVTGLTAATHFAPVARLSPVQQISNAVVASLSSPFGAQNSSAASDLGDETGASGPTDTLAQIAQPSATSIKTLDLQLQPETLGQVTIKLNLSDSGLAVQVETANQQTAELIGKDKQSLTQSLSNSGYSVATVDVSVAPQNASHFSSDASSQQGQADPNAGQSGGQPSGNDGSPNGGRMHDPSAFTGPAPGAQNLAATDGAASVAGNSGRRGLFV